LIDRDRRNQDEIASLENDGIKVLSVAEVENLFCVPEVLKLVAEQLELSGNEVLTAAEDFLMKNLQNELDVQISLHVANEIKFQLSYFDDKGRGASSLKAGLESLV
jgi:hypothetical protein